jgi:hypothetical protein
MKVWLVGIMAVLSLIALAPIHPLATGTPPAVIARP